MSRVGKNPIQMPSSVQAVLNGRTLDIKGPNGSQSVVVPEGIDVNLESNKVTFNYDGESRPTRALWGTVRSLTMSAVKGVSDKFERTIELVGVGFKSAVQGEKLVMQLGYSHDVEYMIPKGVSIKCEKPTLMKVQCADKQVLGQVVSEIMNLKRPEPYKGKGVIPDNVFVVRKEGKKK